MLTNIIFFTLEIVVLLTIGIICYLQYQDTHEQILLLNRLLPLKSDLFVVELHSSPRHTALNENTIHELLVNNKAVLIKIPKPDSEQRSETVYKFINTRQNLDELGFQLILNDFNTYLLKSSSYDIDTQVLQDILSRHYCLAVTKVDLSINLPLYTGLLGTFSGIILGLLGLGQLGIDLFSVNKLLENVALAMVVSGGGLLLTVLNYRQLRSALREAESRKNDLLNFIQIEFIAQKQRDVSTAITILQHSMEGFNQQFQSNLSNFSFSMNKVEQILESQEKILEAFNRSEISQIITSNREMFDHMARSAQAIKEFDGFVLHLKDSSSMLKEAIGHTIPLLTRTQNIEKYLMDLAVDFSSQQTTFQEVAHFFHQQRKEIEQRQTAFGQVIGNLDQAVKEQLDHLVERVWVELEEFTRQVNAKMVIVKSLIDKDLNELEKVYASRITMFDHFSRLEVIEERADQINTLLQQWNNSSRQEAVEKKFDELIESVARIAAELNAERTKGDKIQKSTSSPWNKLFNRRWNKVQ